MNRIDICKNIIQSIKEYITTPEKLETSSCEKSFCSQTKAFSFSSNYVSALHFKGLHVSKSFPYSGRSWKP